MSKIIIGLVGQIASGKGTATDYLKEKYNANSYRFSTMLRDVLDRLYVEQSRTNLQALSTFVREKYGEDTLAKVIAEDVKNDETDIIVVDGVRRPDDIKYLKQIPGFILVHVFADMETRLERISVRGENTDDNKKTLEEFKKEHEQESELKVSEIAETAPEKIDNNGDYDSLHEQLDQLVKKYAGQN